MWNICLTKSKNLLRFKSMITNWCFSFIYFLLLFQKLLDNWRYIIFRRMTRLLIRTVPIVLVFLSKLLALVIISFCTGFRVVIIYPHPRSFLKWDHTILIAQWLMVKIRLRNFTFISIYYFLWLILMT